ncbi:2-dehydropantoate 2-reductase [Bordetella sputigena]|uniref:ketopantoate reductase family protein n=1 Tax=Bordetella sputigena TaxID=1416810 RepID=UPI0039EF64AD
MRRILIVGCGAMGGIFAAHLAKVADVTALDVNAEHVRAIRADGLRVEGPESRTVPLRAVASADEIAGESFDALIFLTKSGQTGAAWSALRRVLAGAPLLLTLQNGMGNSETLRDGGDAPVARGVTLDAGRYLGPGRVQHLIHGNTTWIGPVRGTLDDCAWLARLLSEAGMPAQAITDPMDAVWSKFVFNAVMNPVGALLLGVNRARYETPEVRDLIDDLARECTNVVAALGGRLAFDPMQLVKQTRAGERPITRHAGSMALDIARGVATEIDELTGFVVREGDRLGVDVTACRTVYRLVKGLELARRIQLEEGAPPA